jgi:hypothetical protein
LTIEEVKTTSHAWILDRNGCAAKVKLTSVKTWKRRSDVEVHCRYGLYEFFVITCKDGENTVLFARVYPEAEAPAEA